MDRLWAPWRLSYITTPKDRTPPAGAACFICRALADTNDREHLLVARCAHCAVLLNLYPYNNGHLLVVPNAHKARLDELSSDELLDIQHTIQRMTAVIERRMNADGFNVGLNLGSAAGAGLPGHLHWHVVPRWFGDSNFMTTVSETRVLSQALAALYDLLTDELRTAGE